MGCTSVKQPPPQAQFGPFHGAEVTSEAAVSNTLLQGLQDQSGGKDRYTKKPLKTLDDRDNGEGLAPGPPPDKPPGPPSEFEPEVPSAPCLDDSGKTCIVSADAEKIELGSRVAAMHDDGWQLGFVKKLPAGEQGVYAVHCDKNSEGFLTHTSIVRLVAQSTPVASAPTPSFGSPSSGVAWRDRLAQENEDRRLAKTNEQERLNSLRNQAVQSNRTRAVQGAAVATSDDVRRAAEALAGQSKPARKEKQNCCC